MLTKKQKDLLVFIHEKMSQDDIPPSFEEMKLALGLKSKSGIHRLISALVERGYIQRLPHRARALEILKLPEGMRIDDKVASLSPSLADHNNDDASFTLTSASNDFDEVPLCGKIAAGTPIEAIRSEGECVKLPQGMVGNGEHYALIVDGDSMINAGIHDGDTVIIKQCERVENGSIAVALVDDGEVTLKRIYQKGGEITLQPENDAHDVRTLSTQRVKIQGALAGLLRTYH